MADQIYYSVFTKQGLALLTEAIQNGTKLGITAMAFGDGGGSLPAPNDEFTSLINEVHRTQLNSLAPDPNNANWLRAEAIIASAIGGFNIRELGLYAGDILVAYSNYPATYKPNPSDGTARIMTFRMILQIDNVANFELVIDPDVVLATIQLVNQVKSEIIDYVQDVLKYHPRILTTIEDLEEIQADNGQAVYITYYNRDRIHNSGGIFIFNEEDQEINNFGTIINGWTRIGFEYLCPQMFGVTNNINEDFTENIRAMHEAANKLNIDVKYNGIKTLSIQANAQIIINTNVDFAGCTLKALNGIVESPYWDASVLKMFIVRDEQRIIKTFTINQTELLEGATRFTVPEDIIDGYVFLESNKQIGNRVGYTGRLYFKQPFAISRGGVLNYPLAEDLRNHTVTATYYAEPTKRWLVIKGLNADVTTFNNQCLLKIERNYVKLTEFSFESSVNNMNLSIDYLIWTEHVANFIFEDSIVVAPESVTNTSTYGLVNNYLANGYYKNIIGHGNATWGFCGSIFVNGLLIENCHFGRLDSHEGLFNWRILGGALYSSGLRYGWGGGFLEIESLNIYNNRSALVARPDYDNHFNGSISLRKIKFHLRNIEPSTGNPVKLLRYIYECEALGTTTLKQGTSDVIETKWADSILIEDIEFHHNKDADIVVCSVFSHDTIAASAKVYLPQSITIRNVRAVGNRILFTFNAKLHKHYPYLNNGYKTTRYIFENIESGIDSSTYSFIRKSTASETVADWTKPVFANFTIKNCKGITIWSAIPNAKFNIHDSEISAIRSHHTAATNQNIMLYNSTIKDTVTIQGTNKVGEFGAGAAKLCLYNVSIEDTCELNNVGLSIGTTVLKNIDIIINDAVTENDLFSGYKNSSYV